MIKLNTYPIFSNKSATSYFYMLILSFFLITCNSKVDENSKAKTITHIEPVTVKFIGQWLNEGKREDLVKDIAREFEFSHQDIKIELKFPEEIYYHREDPLSNQKFVASIIKEENPEWDVIRVNNEYQAIEDVSQDPEWAKKSLVDFSEFEEFRKNTLPELLSDSVKNLWHGIIPGPFIEGVNWALWCNTSVANKMGITVKQFDMTFDDFLGYIKAANDYNIAHNDNIIPLFEAVDWKTSIAIAFQLYASELENGKDFFADNVTEKKLNAWHKTLTSLEQLSKYKPLSDKCDTMHWEVGKNLILQDKCLFFSNGSWMYNIWLKNNKDKMKDIMPAEYPVFKTTNIYIGAYQIMWAVLKKAKHRDEAIKFLLAINQPDVANQWARYTKCPTGIKGNFIGTSFGSDQFDAYTNHIDKRYGTKKYNLFANSIYILGASKKEIPNYFYEVIQGQITADEAINKMKAALRRR